jgi:phosphatidylserine/phosphatidylglycerophosphate/cardiolipin synthase-like enzyme
VNGDTAIPSLRVPDVGSEDVTLTFILRVSDANGATDTDSVNVLVAALDQPPVVDADGISLVNEGEQVELDGTDSFDPDGDSLTYTWKQLEGPSVLLSSPHSAKATFRAPYDLAEDATLVFELEVSDGNSASTDTVAITVRDVVAAPKILGTPDYLEDLIYEIGRAEAFVYTSTYYVEDYPSNLLLDALQNATARGVDVRLMFASSTLSLYPDTEERLTSRGIPYKIVSNHAKVTVIDDRIVYVGSANWNKNGLHGNWELSIKLNNPDTVKEAKEFIEAMWKTGSKIVRYYNYPADQFVNGGEYYELLLQKITHAEKIKVLMFQATYTFDDSSAPDTKLLDEINEAYKRGTELQLLFDDPTYHETYGAKQFFTENNIPHKLDDKTTGYLQRIHAKAVLIDDEVLIIGSQNWNRDSLNSSSEASIVTKNPEMILAFLDIFEEKWQAGHYVVGG